MLPLAGLSLGLEGSLADEFGLMGWDQDKGRMQQPIMNGLAARPTSLLVDTAQASTVRERTSTMNTTYTQPAQVRT